MKINEVLEFISSKNKIEVNYYLRQKVEAGEFVGIRYVVKLGCGLKKNCHLLFGLFNVYSSDQDCVVIDHE